jgi:hypothetical protein
MDEIEWNLGAMCKAMDAQESKPIRLGQEIEKWMATLKRLSEIKDEFDLNSKVTTAFGTCSLRMSVPWAAYRRHKSRSVQG